MSADVRSFRRILYGAVARLNLTLSDLREDQKAQFAELCNSAAKLAWEFYPWPEIMDVREEPMLTHPTVTGGRYVPMATAERVLKMVLAVWDSDPRINDSALQVEYVKQADGLYFRGCAGQADNVWVEYRPAAPEFTSVLWADDATYVALDLVWWNEGTGADGHVYVALAAVSAGTLPSDASKWKRVTLPAVLAEPVKTGIVAASRAADGQYGTARMKLDYMQELLEHEIVQIQNEGGSARNYRV